MSDVRKFKFVSPGIFLREIDNSQLPAVSPEVGPVIIGRAKQGPANRPIQVNSFSEFVDVFGVPEGGGGGGDYFREGNIAGPTYGAYAAQAYLDAQVGPVTFVRTLGESNPSADTSDTQAVAGWSTKMEFGEQANNNIFSGSNSRYLNGGAYGLFVLPSASVPGTNADMGSGSLAAIWYCNKGSTIILSGGARGATPVADPTPVSGNCIVLESDSSTGFTAEILNSTGLRVMKTQFNFNRNSDRYIRKVFNTNPTLVNNSDQGYTNPITNNSTLSDGEGTYWLGETFDSYMFEKLGSTSPGTVYGFIAAVNSGSLAALNVGTSQWGDRQQSAINPRSGWFFSQDLTSQVGGGNSAYDARSMTKLFRFHGRDGGEAIQEQYKISIQDIRAATNNFNSYGSFTVVVRAANDSDAKPVVIERFSECNLDPQSPSYVARKIGDRFVEWDYNDARMREYGEFANASEVIRIEMNPDLNSAPAELLPFGVFGPPRPPGFTLLSGSGNAAGTKNNFMPLLGDAGQELLLETTFYDTGDGANYSFFEGSGSAAGTYAGAVLNGAGLVGASTTTAIQTSIAGTDNGGCRFSGSLFFPTTLTRLSASDHGSSDAKSAYWGLQTNYYDAGRASTTFDVGYRDYLRGLPFSEANRFSSITAPPANAEYSWIFTLDDLVVPGGKVEDCYWMSGSRSGVSRENTVAVGESATSSSYKAVLDSGLNRFTSPLFGGFDGFNIIEKDPFRDGVLTKTTTQTETNNYAFNTIAKAINTVKDPEFVEMNMLSVPGVVNENLTQKVLNVCEDRGDALGVIDLRGIYQPFTENANDFKTRVQATSLDGVVSALRDRSLNSSYGCAYYPWVQIQDTLTGQFLWAPPSVAAIGTFASSERASELWFAPAGFNRGGLSKGGAAGLPVTAVTEKLTSADRDTLYEANINPIATFPSEGIVIFGQKTLQVTPSALDRINVRRLMIFIKKEISRIAAGILFDQNVRATWQRFTSQANPLLASVKARMGLTEFKVVLDETTTTPDLIDRNILYAKIFLKPARAIEFIAIDFNITRTGAAFED
tara:strand:+ start:4470 stop:7631 length:3162 start_codon:yes stop_codon:yes gene_type:complete